MFKKINADSVNTLANTIIGLLGTIISVLGIYISYEAATQNQKVLLEVPIRVTLIISSVLFILSIIFMFFRYLFVERNKRIATNFISYSNQDIIKEDKLESIDMSKLSVVERNCLHRITSEPITEIFWQSSWFGAGALGKTSDKVNSIPIFEGRNVAGKIPMVSEPFDGNPVNVFNIKYEHFEKGYWCAVIHGAAGKPIRGRWKQQYDLTKLEYLSFWAKSCDSVIASGQDRDNVDGFPIFYVRFEDVDNITSDSAIIIVPNYWTEFKIPISKFLYNANLYKDYQEFTKRHYFERKGTFKPDMTIQVMFGCSEEMPEQFGNLHIYNIKFI